MIRYIVNKYWFRWIGIAGLCTGMALAARAQDQAIKPLKPVALKEVKITDSFWSPKYRIWEKVTAYDVLDKLVGRYTPDRPDITEEKAKTGKKRDALLNFDLVAQGKKDIDTHDGPPWYDGLLYETIRGAADLLVIHPDPVLERKIDTCVDHIAAAQAADPDGYINTYTTLTRSSKRWGTNDGDDKWQHDIYNAGMLTEAAVHYYQATGKTKLLTVAVKMANYMDKEMGPAPKKNVIPGHGGSEEALIKLYRLFKTEPSLKTKLHVPVQEDRYLALARFWIENRGNYGVPGSSYSRKSDSSYNQDHLPVLQQQTIEGHAVRATLLATGVTAMALENGDSRYINTAGNYWDNMIGKRMFITGGEGAIADGERFGADYYLPESAYLETCASIGAGFFTQQMNELKADGKYMDELERVLYNNLLSGISLSGDHYFYENPLKATDNHRWAWHSCPCCPPMILKMVAAMPQYIYAHDDDALYVNLFVGSEATLPLKKQQVQLSQKTQYPWSGNINIQVAPQMPQAFTLKVRIPGWAEGKENPFDLYRSQVNGAVALKVNGKEVPVKPVNGYAAIHRTWKKGDVVELVLPMQPRLVYPNDAIQTVKGKVALASGPVVYALEGADNLALDSLAMMQHETLKLSYKADLLDGVNIIRGTGNAGGSSAAGFTAIPFYAVGNREISPYKVWLPVKQ